MTIRINSGSEEITIESEKNRDDMIDCIAKHTNIPIDGYNITTNKEGCYILKKKRSGLLLNRQGKLEGVYKYIHTPI